MHCLTGKHRLGTRVPRGMLKGSPAEQLKAAGVSAADAAGPPPVNLGPAAVAAWQAQRVATRLRALREGRGWSRPELARRAGVHWRTIENVERMWTWPDFITLVTLFAQFDVDPLAGIGPAWNPKLF